MNQSPLCDKKNSDFSDKTGNSHYLCKYSGSGLSSGSLHFNSVSNSLGLSTSKEESPISTKFYDAVPQKSSLPKTNWYSSSTNASGGPEQNAGQPHLSMTFSAVGEKVSEFDLKEQGAFKKEVHKTAGKEEKVSTYKKVRRNQLLIGDFGEENTAEELSTVPREELNSSMTQKSQKKAIEGNFLTPNDSEDELLDKRLKEIQWKKQMLEDSHEKRKPIKETKSSPKEAQINLEHVLPEILSRLMEGIVDLHLGVIDSLSSEETRALPSSVPKTEEDFKMMRGDSMGLLCTLADLMMRVCQMRLETKKALEELVESYKECSNYEVLLQKLEGDLRQHIRIEQQLKLHVESTQEKLEEKEKEEQFHESLKLELDLIRAENASLKQAALKNEEEMGSLREQTKFVYEEKKIQEEEIRSLQNQIAQLKYEISSLAKPKSIQPSTQIYQNTFDFGNKENIPTIQNTPSFHEVNPVKRAMEKAKQAQKPECPASGSTSQNPVSSSFHAKILNFFSQKDDPSLVKSVASRPNSAFQPQPKQLNPKATKNPTFLKLKEVGTKPMKSSRILEKKGSVVENVSNYHSGPQDSRATNSSKSREKNNQNYGKKTGSLTQRPKTVQMLMESDKPIQDADCFKKKPDNVIQGIRGQHSRNQTICNMNRITSNDGGCRSRHQRKCSMGNSSVLVRVPDQKKKSKSPPTNGNVSVRVDIEKQRWLQQMGERVANGNQNYARTCETYDEEQSYYYAVPNNFENKSLVNNSRTESIDYSNLDWEKLLNYQKKSQH